MRQCLSIGNIVDGDKLDFIVVNRRAKNISTDAPKTINANLNRHSVTSRCCLHTSTAAFEPFELNRVNVGNLEDNARPAQCQAGHRARVPRDFQKWDDRSQ
jgi:hypothetical protein